MEEGTDQGSAARQGDKPAEHASGCNKVAGDGLGLIVTPSVTLPKAGERAVHFKAIRRLVQYLKEMKIVEGFGDREFDALVIVATWCVLTGLQGGPISKIVDWSGYRPRWKYRVMQGIQICVTLDMLEFLKVSGGKRLCLTIKGQRVLDIYDKMYDQVEGEFRQTYITATVKDQNAMLQNLATRRQAVA